MRGQLLHSRGDPQHSGSRPTGRRHDVHDHRPPDGHRSGLVQHRDSRTAQRFQRPAVAQDDTDARGTRHAGRDRDRNREKQRARGRGDQHGDRTRQLTRGQRGQPGHRHGDGQEHRGDPVGDAHDRRARGRCFLGKSNDAGVGAVLRRGGCPQVDRRANDHHTAAHAFTAQPCHRFRLARQRRLVERRVAEQHGVDRDDLARTHDDNVTGNDRVHLDLTQANALAHLRVPGCSVEQCAQIPASPAPRVLVQRVPSTHHHRDNRSREVLPDHERSDQGEDSEHVGTEPLRAQVVDHPPHGRDDCDRRGRGPPDPRTVRILQPHDSSRRGGQHHGDEEEVTAAGFHSNGPGVSGAAARATGCSCSTSGSRMTTTGHDAWCTQ